MIRLALLLSLVATMSLADPKDDAFASWLQAFRARAAVTGITDPPFL
jgi:hypothetical protein